MKSIKHLSNVPAGTAVTSDSLVEYHALRLILIILLCGVRERQTGRRRIDGLTKLAKLDFFVRYPDFFKQAAEELGISVEYEDSVPEPQMVRYHYGPWDHRYYQVLPYLEARGIVEVKKDPVKNQYKFYLNPHGVEIAEKVAQMEEFLDLAAHVRKVKNVLGNKTGNQLKELIYRVFDEEVAQRKRGDAIN